MGKNIKKLDTKQSSEAVIDQFRRFLVGPKEGEHEKVELGVLLNMYSIGILHPENSQDSVRGTETTKTLKTNKKLKQMRGEVKKIGTKLIINPKF